MENILSYRTGIKVIEFIRETKKSEWVHVDDLTKVAEEAGSKGLAIFYKHGLMEELRNMAALGLLELEGESCKVTPLALSTAQGFEIPMEQKRALDKWASK